MKTAEERAEAEAMVHELLERVADKWTLLVIDALEEQEEVRFTALRDRVRGISQKMLTKTLRQMERDGLVTRRVHPVIPPRVDYRLTRLGESLAEAVCSVWTWVERHKKDVVKARSTFDARRE
jgi:DNA-binding HxlR family transcriptional regulator